MAGANAVFTGEQMLTTPCEYPVHHLYLVQLAQLNLGRVEGSPWDEDKAMMGRWGLTGMQSFEQTNVARKEGSRLATSVLEASSEKQALQSQKQGLGNCIP